MASDDELYNNNCKASAGFCVKPLFNYLTKTVKVPSNGCIFVASPFGLFNAQILL